MDFFRIGTKELKDGSTDIFPDFIVGRSKDLMVRGKAFYAIWDESQNLWSTDEFDVIRLVDQALREYADKHCAGGKECNVKYLSAFGNNVWAQFRRYISLLSDNSHQLDETLTFADTPMRKGDYVSRRLPYSLTQGDFSAWDELVGTLYSPEERAKIEWAIGSVLAGDSKKIQKFLVLYGPGGTGKSTVLNIIGKLFEGYTASFEAKALVGNNNAFATEVFRTNPLVAIQHDGDLSKIEDNSKLNSIISHERITMNEKYKSSYTSQIVAMLFMGTNKPVRISDAKSGIIRRLIDVHPSGNLLQPRHYHALMARIDFELGAIAHHCLEVYRSMGKNYYNAYKPLEMMLQTDIFFNFVEAHFDIFKGQNGVSLKQAYTLYKQYCNDTGVEFVMPQYKLRDELRNYFARFHDRLTVEGTTMRSYYEGFTAEAFKVPISSDSQVFSLVLDEKISLFDLEYGDYAAQEAKDDGTPRTYWANVKTTLSQIDTSQLHYVKVPDNHIVIDFDLRNENGEKDLEKNLAAASEWPPTYGELSQSGKGVHLHYIYTGGDPSELARAYMDGIEVKVYHGDASLRRRLSKCNRVPVSEISSGLPLKEKKVLTAQTIQSEKGLRDLIARNLRKEIHPGTKPSIDFIEHILDEAYMSGMVYDVSDLQTRIIAFANNSKHQPLNCLKVVTKMRFKSDEPIEPDTPPWEEEKHADEPLVFYDVEVFPNLFVVCWKYAGEANGVPMINPTPQEVEKLFGFKLVGFNNRRYDNHMLWARYMGYNNEQLYKLSQKIIDEKSASLFGEAYNLSYADIFDFASVKKGLKKWQIDLGIHHKELELPWDQPVKDEDIPRVVEYCMNDVDSSEVLFFSRDQDWAARQILADLSGLTVNDTTQKHTARIIFGDDRNPQASFVYTDLNKEFPGYVYDKGKSTYRGEVTGEGGYVYAEPGMYSNVAVLDVASMHPTSIEQLNLFGDEYTKNFAALTKARLAIKRGDYSSAKKMLGGKLAKYLVNEEQAGALSDALKIVINIVYGLTSAKFDNAFRDNRNKDNIVAKRGALFMIDLKHAVQEQGFTVAHIKTDSIKIPDATPEIIDFVKVFGEKYGYDFEYKPEKDHYDQFCLVNDAVYIARVDECITPKWTAVGAQFQHPYVFKKLFTKEEITFDDLCEAKSVTQGAMYLDFASVSGEVSSESSMRFVGRTGLFVPVMPSTLGAGVLYRVKDDKKYAVSGTKGHVWLEVETFTEMDLSLDDIDMTYFEHLSDQARDAIDYYGPYTSFVA
jgi:hypothetical protein